ncbi:hypothetical protein MN202_18725 [Rheinheimera muenzenbergensis]|uniref:Lipocalin-like domain-containing protein n=1 Tax=Rheinheimera muenzenbergensis TaxID=1193628 RepID=A0ABU8CBS6_9GAMM
MLKIVNFAIVTVVAIGLMTRSDASEANDILGRWVMTEVVYDDGSINQLEAGNFVDINADTITEVIKSYGNRQYPYTRQDKVLRLTAGDEQISWQIFSEATNRLELATPLGKYVLTR